MALNWFKKKSKSQPPAGDQTEIPSSEAPTAATPAPNENQVTSEMRQEDESEPTSQPEPFSPPPSKSGNGLFSRLKRGLSKTREILNTDIEDLFKGKRQVDDEMLEEIEELLITSDIGVQTAMDLMKTIHRKASRIENPEALKKILKEEILALIAEAVSPAGDKTVPEEKPHIVMVIGVNGVGKTTTIGKLAARKVQDGQKVMIAAADTFRAAASEQLAVWAQRANAELIRHKDNADPAAVAYDSIEAAIARGADTVFVDTAGRLHTKVNLMEELKKIHRTINKKLPRAPHEILLVLDATTGQNAISQAKMFHEALGITGLVLTKLDGTAKGGIVISICRQLKLPIHFIGVGESIEDLQPFEATRFVDALF